MKSSILLTMPAEIRLSILHNVPSFETLWTLSRAHKSFSSLSGSYSKSLYRNVAANSLQIKVSEVEEFIGTRDITPDLAETLSKWTTDAEKALDSNEWQEYKSMYQRHLRRFPEKKRPSFLTNETHSVERARFIQSWVLLCKLSTTGSTQIPETIPKSILYAAHHLASVFREPDHWGGLKEVSAENLYWDTIRGGFDVPKSWGVVGVKACEREMGESEGLDGELFCQISRREVAQFGALDDKSEEKLEREACAGIWI